MTAMQLMQTLPHYTTIAQPPARYIFGGSTMPLTWTERPDPDLPTPAVLAWLHSKAAAAHVGRWVALDDDGIMHGAADSPSDLHEFDAAGIAIYFIPPERFVRRSSRSGTGRR